MKNGININTKDILKLAFPAIIAGIAEPLISLTDVAVIGNMDDNAVEGLLAVGLVGSFLSAIIWTLAQTKTSLSSIVSKAVGEQTAQSLKPLIPQAVWLNIALGILIYAVTAPLATYIFTLYNATDHVLELSVDYYQIRAIGFPITLSAFAIFGVFRGLQNTSWAMMASLCGALVNVVLDYVLVYGIADLIPSYGVMGAAYASLVAQLVMLLIAVFYLYHKTPFSLSLSSKVIHPKLKNHIALAANFFLRTAAINLAIFLSYRYASGYGETYGAAHAIMMNIWLFFSFFIDGFANAGNAIGGKLLGSRDAISLRYLAKKTTTYGVVVAITLALLCATLYTFIGNQFTDDEVVLTIFLNVFWMVLIMQPINAVAFVFDGIFKGWGEASYLRNLLFILTLGVFIPTLLIADFLGWKLHAIWLAFTFWMIGRAVVLYLKFQNRVNSIDR